MFNASEMTEEAWLAGGDPGQLMEAATKLGWVSPRKLRLWACACCRRIWPLLVDECSRRAVEVAERFADGLATEAERLAAYDAALAEPPFDVESADSPPESVGWREAAEAALGSVAGDDRLIKDPYELVYRTTKAVSLIAAAKDPWLAAAEAYDGEYRDRFEAFTGAIEAAEELEQARLVRDVCGNPFRPVALDPAWLTATVIAPARGIYEERALDRLPVLADALQDAGCEDAELLGHCRGPGPHVRGCWVVDLLLGNG